MSHTPDNLPKLTDKQRAFVEAYLDCLNATEAARRAEYKHPNKQGPALLVNLGVAAAIQAGLAERAMPTDEVLARLSAIARADIRDILLFSDEDQTDEAGQVTVPAGTMTGLRLHRDAPWHLVKSFVMTRYGPKVELHDQHAALRDLARAHGLLNTFDWSKVPQAIIDAIADGRLTIDDLKRLAATSGE